MTNDGENMGNDPMVDLRDSDIESEDSEGGIAVVSEVWPVFPVVVPEPESHCIRTLRQEEWAVMIHDRYRLGLCDAVWEWVARSSELGPGDSVRITEPLHPVFNYCGKVVSYDRGNHETQVQLRKEVM